MEKSILIATPSSEAAEQLRKILTPAFRAHVVEPNLGAVKGALQTRRIEFLFLDIACLESNNTYENTSNYKDALRPFWQISQSMRLIVITPPEKLEKR